MKNNYWTKKRIIMFVLYWVICCFCIWLFVVSTLASDSNFKTGTYNNDCVAYSDINPHSCIATYEQYNSSFNYDNFNYWYKYEPASNRMILYFVPKDYVLVRTESNGAYYWYAYSYDGTKLVAQNFEYEIYMRIGDSSARLQSYGSRVSGIDENIADFSGPYATSKNYALKYFQTMDSSWLENGDQFVDVPKPMNLSFYLASSENGGYLYWENELYEGMLYPSTEVILTYQYSNLDGEYTNITSQSIYLDYNTRNQQFVDFSVFNEYDNGRVVAFVRNKLNNYVNGKEFVGDFVKLEYVLDSDIYYSYSSDTDANPKQYPIVDYENKNPSYTGGTGGTSLFPGLESDYGWLDGVFNAFGLVGDNGLVQFMGDLFSFIPTPIFVALSGFIFASIIIALFKMFVK